MRLKFLIRNFFCHFAFAVFTFWIIQSSSCNSFNCSRFQQETEFHFFKILQCFFFENDISINCIISVTKGVEQRNKWIFLAQYTPSPIHLLCPKWNTSLLLLSSMHFFGKQFAKHSKIFWIKNILNKLLFLFDNSKLINKFFTAPI